MDKNTIHNIANTINTFTLKIQQDIIDMLDNEYDYAKNRTDKSEGYNSRENVNALILEKSLLAQGKIKVLPKLKTENIQWRHDWAYSENNPRILIDLKRYPADSSTQSISISPEKIIQSYEMKPAQVTHIVAYQQNIETDYKNNIGKTLKFKFLGWLPIKEAIKYSFKVSGKPFNLLKISNLNKQ